jgi:hypothetical protein
VGGHGQGLWPAHPVFRYREEVTFAATGKAFLTYQQRTFALDDGRALHVETGYLRGVGGDGVEFLIVQPTGYTEIHTGTMTPHGLTLQLADLSPSPAALRVTDLYRRIALEGRALTYLLRLAMHQEPLSDHLAGRAAPADPVPVNRHERPGTHPTVGAAPARTGGPDWSPAAAVTFARSMGAGMATGWARAWHRALTGWSRSFALPWLVPEAVRTATQVFASSTVSRGRPTVSGRRVWRRIRRRKRRAQPCVRGSGRRGEPHSSPTRHAARIRPTSSSRTADISLHDTCSLPHRPEQPLPLYAPWGIN